VHSPPNGTLLQHAARVHGAGRLLDIGCGAGRNALPLVQAGWEVFATDLSLPMVQAAAARASEERLTDRLRVLLAPMDNLPFRSACFDFIVAHGIWNLARSAVELRAAVREAARVARPGATLFLFTFSRSTLDDAAAPLPGETFVFTQFSGQPQCFLTSPQVAGELGAAGFEADPSLPLHELNKRPPGSLVVGNAPVIWEGMFRRCD
jgi:SAM-dependent methyltransferase